MAVKCYHYCKSIFYHLIIHLRSMSDKMFTSIITVSCMFFHYITHTHSNSFRFIGPYTKSHTQAHASHPKPKHHSNIKIIIVRATLKYVTFYINTIQNINFIVFSFIIWLLLKTECSHVLSVLVYSCVRLDENFSGNKWNEIAICFLVPCP